MTEGGLCHEAVHLNTCKRAAEVCNRCGRGAPLVLLVRAVTSSQQLHQPGKLPQPNSNSNGNWRNNTPSSFPQVEKSLACQYHTRSPPNQRGVPGTRVISHSLSGLSVLPRALLLPVLNALAGHRRHNAWHELCTTSRGEQTTLIQAVCRGTQTRFMQVMLWGAPTPFTQAGHCNV
jgi:hypothetical protein